MKHIASVSFGKDSLAMLLRLIEENWPLDYVIFYNTGMEFDCIYNIRDKVKPILQERGISYVELNPKRPFLYSMLEKKVCSKQKGVHLGYVGVEACAAGEHPKNYSLSENSKEA